MYTETDLGSQEQYICTNRYINTYTLTHRIKNKYIINNL